MKAIVSRNPGRLERREAWIVNRRAPERPLLYAPADKSDRRWRRSRSASCWPLATAERVPDGKQLDLGERRSIFLEDVGIARPVVMLGRELLAFRAGEVFQVSLRHRRGPALVRNPIDDCDRRLGEDAGRRRDDVETTDSSTAR